MSMNAKKFSLVTLIAILLFAGSTSSVFAKDNDRNDNNDHRWYQFWKRDNKNDDRDKGHKNDRDKDRDRGGRGGSHRDKKGYTLVSGTVYDSSNVPVSGGSVTVNCGSASKTVAIGSDGRYEASFTQAECKKGDAASANASTSKGSGSGSSTVYDGQNEGYHCNVDVAVIDITVPELGVVGGAVSSVISVAGYLAMKSRMKV